MDGQEGICGRTSPAPAGDLAAGDYVAFAAPSPDPPPPLPSPPPPVSEDIHVSRSWRRAEGAEDDAIEILDCGGELRLDKMTEDDFTKDSDALNNVVEDASKENKDENDFSPRANGLSKAFSSSEPEHTPDSCGTECLFCAISCCDYCVIM